MSNPVTEKGSGRRQSCDLKNYYNDNGILKENNFSKFLEQYRSFIKSAEEFNGTTD